MTGVIHANPTLKFFTSLCLTSSPSPTDSHPHNISWVMPTLPLTHYDAVEVYGCINTSQAIERFEAPEHSGEVAPHFWSVALHLEAGHIETIADFPKEAIAETFGSLMREVLLYARNAAGLSSPHLQPSSTT